MIPLRKEEQEPCEPELSYLLIDFFNIYWNKSYFPDSWRFLPAQVFKNVRESSEAKIIPDKYFQFLVRSLRNLIVLLST